MSSLWIFLSFCIRISFLLCLLSLVFLTFIEMKTWVLKLWVSSLALCPCIAELVVFDYSLPVFAVFDCCFSKDVLEEDEYRVYMGGIVAQLQDHFPDASFMVFNFREGERRSQISDIFSQYDMTVMEYPRQYEGCPLLPLEMIHHFLRSSESWLSLEGQQNVLLIPTVLFPV